MLDAAYPTLRMPEYHTIVVPRAPEISSFLVLQACAVLGAMALFERRLRLLAVGDSRAHRARIAVAMAFGSLAGALLLGLGMRLPRVLFADADIFARGLAMAYGALAGAALATVAATRRLGAPPAALDALAPALGVMVVIGRVGCWFAGCCFGRPSTAAWAVAFGAGTPAHVEHVRRGLVPSDATASLPVHPTQLYEALVGVAMIAAGIVLAKGRRRGAAFAAVALLYAVGRFAVEILRDDPRPMSGPLSLPQWLSLLVVAAVVWMALRQRE